MNKKTTLLDFCADTMRTVKFMNYLLDNLTPSQLYKLPKDKNGFIDINSLMNSKEYNIYDKFIEHELLILQQKQTITKTL